MQQSLNPWITRPAPADGADTAAPEAHVPPAAVISEPLRGMVEPDAADRLAAAPSRAPQHCGSPAPTVDPAKAASLI